MVVRFVCDKSIPKAVLTEATGGSLKYNLTVRAAAACPVGRCTASAGTRHTFATLLAEQEEIRSRSATWQLVERLGSCDPPLCSE
mmetsp:Transcript_6654/g.20005  ORF Transcript_6654/g.20005 Transcript_6654/m.20005 type:complete len:85 (+) Transcript_6654:134-388(+)